MKEIPNMTDNQINAVMKFCREEFLNDGAEGESVHKLCDYIDKLRKEVAKLVEANDSLEDEITYMTAGEDM